MKKFKSIISSYGFWTGLSAAVIMLAGSIAKAFGATIDNKIIEDIIMSVCGVLAVFGVVSIPPTVKKSAENNQEKNTQEQDK